MDEILKAVLETEVDEETSFEEYFEKAKVSEKGQNALKSALRMLNAYKDELPKDALDKLAAAAGYPAPKKAKMEDEEEEYPAPKKGQKKEDEEEMKVKKDAEIEAVRKSYDDQLSALKEQNEKIEKALEAERGKREMAEWVEKTKTELSYFPGKSSEELAKSLKALHDVDPKLAEEAFEEKKKISKMVEESELLKEAGQNVSGGGNADGPWAKIEKLAGDMVEKSSDLSLSKSAAINKVLDTPMGKELYKKYLDDNPRQVQ